MGEREREKKKHCCRGYEAEQARTDRQEKKRSLSSRPVCREKIFNAREREREREREGEGDREEGEMHHVRLSVCLEEKEKKLKRRN